MKNIIVIITSIFLSGCVLIFPNSSKVKIDAPDEESTVKIGYVNTYVKDISEVIYYGNVIGDSVIKVNNQKPAVIVKAEKEGYKSSSKFFFRTDYNPFTILDLPLWVVTLGFIPYTLSDGEMKPLKKFSYNFNTRPLLKFPENKDKLFFIRVDSVKEQNTKIFYYQNVSINNLYKDGLSIDRLGIDPYNFEFHSNTNSLRNFSNSRLKNWGYSDTTGKAINTIYLTAELTKIKIRNFNGYFVSDIGCQWTAFNSLTEEILYSKIINYTSEAHKVFGYFSSSSMEKHRTSINKSIEDAFESTLIEFLSQKEFDEAGVKFSSLLKNDLTSTEIKLEYDSLALIKSLKECYRGFLSIHNKKIAGTATLIDKSGYALTNFELLMYSDLEKNAIATNGKKYEFDLIKNFPENNLSLIKLINTDTLLKFNSLAIKSSPGIGDEIYLVNIEPGDDAASFSLNKGIISSVYTRNGIDEIQIDVSYNFWNSGSAVVNKKGEIIGVVAPGLNQSKSLTVRAIATSSLLKYFKLGYR